ncbi:DNA methyltransferase [Flavobacterium degerlachei]|jgi:site-specific DNA-methyltransferase (adenine-specific)|uniref:Methyltransferase n=1 Tax=Flavobacterium degerlachei TaxID=229203 RepID=A0A1H3B4N4_9FLAO|nr:DNA methyltransferase [Flavobacterium degerlachei]SDX36019.1 site-specific DNA-methyltransferase (adenine-specific) [Flavobacterium degerlachei]
MKIEKSSNHSHFFEFEDKLFLYKVDNMNLMRKTANHFFDLAECDPPYFSGPEKRQFYGNKHSKINVKRKDYPITEKWILPTKEWFAEVKRVSKNQIIWGANYYDFIGTPFKTPRGIEINDFIKQNPTGWIIWDKCNGNSSFNDYELAWTSFDKPTLIFKYMWNGMLQGKSMHSGHIMQGNKKLNQKKIHPTEKPIILYDWQFKNYTAPGMKIFSSHLGSGSDALSSLKFDLIFYGAEIEEKHFTNAVDRIKKNVSQAKIQFDFI